MRTTLWQVRHAVFGLVQCDLKHLDDGECEITLRRDGQSMAMFAEVFPTRLIGIRRSLDLHAAFTDRGWQDVPESAGVDVR